MRRRALFTTSAIAAATATALAGLAVPRAEAAPPSVVGAQTVGDTLFPDQGNGGYDVGSYDLAIAWATTNVITATATITMTAPVALEQFSLDLEGLTVTSVKVDDVAAAFTRQEAGAKHKLVVTPATPVSGTFTTTVAYNGTPVTHTDPDGSDEGWVATTGLVSGAVALNEPVGAMTWFPNNNTPRDKATYTMRLTVPYNAALGTLNRVATSNGVLQSTTVNGSTRTFVWHQPHQQASYLAMVGIGQYDVAQSDVALTTGTTHEWTYSDPTAAGATQVTATRGKLSAVLKGIERYYGAYPGSSTGLVLDVSSLGYALETQDRPYFENTVAESTLIHELAHQWFGDAVSPEDWSDVWLNEGPATFIETQVAADLDGSASTQDTYYDAWNSSSATAAMWTTPAAGFSDASKLFDSQVYTRGAIALEALRSSLGDGVFALVMRTWIQTYGGGTASTADFVDLAESVSGHDLTAFFQEWIYDTDKPAAWPASYDLALHSAPVSGSTVSAGEHVAYTLDVTNTGKVAMAGGAHVVEVDVAGLLASGDLDTLPAGMALDGTTLEWTVPSTSPTAHATVTFGATLDSGGPVVVAARGRTLGADCGVCSSTLTIAGTPQVSPAPTPVVSGPVVRVGVTLAAQVGTWDDGATLAYQWRRDGVDVPGATGTEYTAVAADLGARLTFVVTGTEPGVSPAVRPSDPTVPVALGVQTKRPRPTVTGEFRVGKTLTAVPGTHDPGVTLGYRWMADGKPIKGATGRRLTLTPSMRGAYVVVLVTASKPGYHRVDRTSRRKSVRKA